MKLGVIIALVIVFVTLLSGAYTVHESEQVIVTQFGRPIGEPIRAAGLHFKVPFIQDKRSFEKRALEWDGDPQQVPTLDKKFIKVDTTARWRIADPLLFLQTVRTEIAAQSRLDDILDSAARDAISSHDLIEAVRSSNREMIFEELEASDGEERTQFGTIVVGRQQLAEGILEQASSQVERYGIELIDFRIKKINYVEDVRRKVYDRMVSERRKIAEKTRSEGQGKRQEIDGLREKRLLEIRSGAYRRAEEIRGVADAEAAGIYAEAYSSDPEFFAFVETLKAYEDILDEGTTLFLSSESELMRYLDGGQ